MGYTDSQGAFYIYLDISSSLVGSGSEDGKARVWDRHYGCHLASLQHTACVNCVAFSPRTDGIVVTVADDHSIKVWTSSSFHKKRSSTQEKELEVQEMKWRESLWSSCT